MMALLAGPTAIWLLLTAATCLSWVLGHEVNDHRLGSVAVILIAIVKIRFVLMSFMELRHAPLAWRLMFEGWMVTLTVAMVTLYLVH